MSWFARVFVMALIAVFAAWTAAHVASATTMSLEMVAVTPADGEVMDMADCDACGSGEMSEQATLGCDIACVSPVLADLATSQAVWSAPMASLHSARPVYDFAGRTYSPDPHPPRAVLLI